MCIFSKDSPPHPLCKSPLILFASFMFLFGLIVFCFALKKKNLHGVIKKNERKTTLKVFFSGITEYQ